MEDSGIGLAQMFAISGSHHFGDDTVEGTIDSLDPTKSDESTMFGGCMDAIVAEWRFASQTHPAGTFDPCRNSQRSAL